MTDLQFAHVVEIFSAAAVCALFALGFIGGYMQ